MTDPFIGTWKLDPGGSRFDPNHQPAEATMRFELDAEGAYVMTADGRNERGEPCAEKPQRFVPDGRAYPVPGFPGLVAITTRLDGGTLHGQVRREDGTVAGEGTYGVSPDGTTLTATAAGFDTQLRRFETTTVWTRV